MKRFTKIKLTLLALLMQGVVFAQQLKTCGSDEVQRKVFKEHPELLQNYLEEEKMYSKLDKQAEQTGYAAQKAAGVVYIIPVVFHIIHMYGPENLSDAKVREAVDVMNKDFRKLNADTANTIALFKPIAADCEIEFRLAEKDPNGNCTNGIDRVVSPETNNGSDQAKLHFWPANKYLNIWVVRKMSASHASAAAYAYFPGTAPAGADGIICLYDYVGSNAGNSHTLSHEAGHYLKLSHVWGGTNEPNVACGDDNVTDTPDTKGSPSSCNLNLALCNAPTIENVQNFMDYSFCSTMFTLGQKTRMRNALNSSQGSRDNLWTASNLSSTGTNGTHVLCAADFGSNSQNGAICEDGLVTYSDLSYNGAVNSRTWTIAGGTLEPPSAPGDSSITVRYPTLGSYDVSLSVTSGATTFSKTKAQYITVSPNIASYTTFTESFENANLPGTDWDVQSTDNGTVTWKTSTTAGAGSLKSAFIENTNALADSGDVDELISPPINVQATGSNYVYYKYAFRRRTSVDKDVLRVYVSSDCGKSWALRKTISGASLATVIPPSFTNFVPTAADWRQDSASIVSVSNKTSVRVKFQFTNGEGNNFYLDDVNITGYIGLNELDLSGTTKFNLFPNPANGITTLSFELKSKSEVTIELTNLLGEKMSLIANSEKLEAGNQLYEINKNNSLIAGVYFIKATINGKTTVKKLVIH